MNTIIDNATISSVQRALGMISIPNKEILDVEHVALERFVQAVLLSDRVLIPDTYIEEYRRNRKTILSNPVFDHRSITNELDQEFTRHSESISTMWRHVFQSGKQSEMLPQYIQQAGAFAELIWEHSGSAFFLVFRALGIDKRSPLIEAILTNKADYNHGKGFMVIDSLRNAVTWSNLSSHVQKMLSVLAWLGLRYSWYQQFAEYTQSVYQPHPLRDFFACDFLSRSQNVFDGGRFTNPLLDGIEIFGSKLSDKLNSLYNHKANLTIEIPFFTLMILKNSTTKEDFLSTLFQLRDEHSFRQLRNRISEASDEMGKGVYTKITDLQQEVQDVAHNLTRRSGIERCNLFTGPKLSIATINTSAQSATLKSKLPTWLYQQWFLNKRYRCFIHDTMQELLIPSKLGDFKDRLNSYADVKESDYPSFYLKEATSDLFHRTFESSTPPMIRNK